MYHLEGIKQINSNAVARYKRGQAETETSRHCSYTGTVKEGMVLHSAKQRATVFIIGSKAKQFLAAWLGTNSTTKHDALVESYFQHSVRC